MVLVGRIVRNAVVSQLKDERKVVNFSIAVNDYYKPKNASERVKITTYYNCAYWIAPKIAERLTKGSLIEISGRIYATAYNGVDGEARASLHCHVNEIKIHSAKSTTQQKEKKVEVAEDLPF